MERTYIADIKNNLGKPVLVQGFVENLRDSKYMAFIVLKDITGKIQITVEKEKLPELCPVIATLTQDSVISVVGTAVENDFVKMGGVEIIPESITAESIADALPIVRKEIPATKKRPGVERSSIDQRIDYRWIDLRTDENQLMFKIQTAMVNAMREFLIDRNFIEIHTPKLIGAASESGAEVFEVKYFDRLAYLAQSPQFYKQMAMASGFERIFEVGPVFRAEKSYTQRHAAEFWMIEPEIAFADLEDDMELAEAMIKYVISYVMESCKSELEFLNKFVDKGLLERLHSVVSSDFARVTYTDAVKELEKYNDEFDYKVYWGCDLQTEHERCLTERIFKRPVFVTDYPKEIKAFYMRLNDDGKTVAAADCLVPGIGEIIGGSQREERLDVLTERIEELGLDPKDYWWYLDLRRYGGVKHSGFGLGFERLVMYLTGISNIRDVLPFPRTTGSADF